ncbi:hypothetical protein [Alcaligenes sp. WGS1538]|uniref:hypothetical protein n=1 Tax=Alcaligenes sp. WGS1538 TaxID=3366811 RepID=UPI00372D3251
MASFISSDKFSNYYSTHQLSESRLERLKDPDKTKATHLGLWDKFKDLFLTNKKQDALNALHDAIHGDSATGKLEAFETLKSCAGHAYQDRFTKQVDDNGIISLLIDEDLVTTCSVKEALYINDDVPMRPMTTDEKELFLKILDVVKEKDRTMVGAEDIFVNRKFAVQEAVMADLYAVYRPSEDPARSTVEWKRDEVTRSMDDLKWLNAGTFDPFTQFNRVGYQYNPIMEAVEFRMVHPSISFLMGTYSNIDEFAETTGQDKELLMLSASQFLNEMAVDYDNYQEKKPAIDKILNELYELHGDTLCIGNASSSRNRLSLLAGT